MKRYLFFLYFCYFTYDLSAQHSLQGILLNKQNDQFISDAKITIIEKNLTCRSNQEGFFVFKNILPEKYHIKISHFTFGDTTLRLNLQQYSDTFKIYLDLKLYSLDEINVTAMRWQRKNENTLSRLSAISEEDLQVYPATNIDNYLQAIPNVYVNRSWGIFSKNASVTMHGLDGTSRVLVLLDGTPLNLSAGGGINWHMIESGQLEKIEIIKGPSSAIYGNNAMGGVINMISKKPANSVYSEISILGGTYNTFGGKFLAGNSYLKDENGFSWSAGGFYRQGDGYIIVPENERDSTDVPLKLKEYNLDFTTSYQFNTKNKIQLKYLFYDDKRNEGIKIYEKDGSFLKYTTHHLLSNYSGKTGKFDFSAKAFYHRQNYYQHSERLNQTGDSYKLYDRKQISEDFGLWLCFQGAAFNSSEISYGADFKQGRIYAEDIYFTSTDYIERAGNLNYYALFIQDETIFPGKKLILNLGFRADIASFSNGFLNVENPTSVTGFETSEYTRFSGSNWSNLSPKIGLKYKLKPNFHLYTSFATGFMPPKLDDMVSSRKVNKGFKIANPALKPETLLNYEFGMDINPVEKLRLQASAYFSSGFDFQYFAHTGDTVDEDLPVIIRDNVSKATVKGSEVSANWEIHRNITLKANYTFNLSQITEFISKTNNEQDNLTGKEIAESPPHQAFLGVYLKNPYVNFSIVSNYVSAMWSDEYNMEKLDPYFLVDVGLNKHIKGFTFGLDIQNILDNQYIDKKNGLSPGRFIQVEIGYQLFKDQ